MLSLQRMYGNQAVQSLLAYAARTAAHANERGGKRSGKANSQYDVQDPALSVNSPENRVTLRLGQPHDRDERAADQVAEAVVATADSQAKPGEIHTEHATVRRSRQQPPLSEMIHPASTGTNTPQAIPDGVHAQINNARGQGHDLPAAMKSYFSPRLGHDLSGVRLHTDARAAQIAQTLKARALTFGRDVFFGAGQYVPATHDGKKLIAHELTHVLQQGHQGALVQRKIQLDTPTITRENPIDQVLHDAPELGLTTPTVNGTAFPDDFKKAGELLFAAIQPKTIGYDGKNKACRFNDFDLNLSANVILASEPEDNKWTKYFPGADTKIAACHDKGDIPVIMKGKPSSEAIAQAIATNEQEHVDDLKKLCKKHLEPHFAWLMALKATGDEKRCQENLLGQLGDKGAVVVKDFLTDLAEAIKKRDEGGRHTFHTDTRAKNRCSRIEIEASKK